MLARKHKILTPQLQQVAMKRIKVAMFLPFHKLKLRSLKGFLLAGMSNVKVRFRAINRAELTQKLLSPRRDQSRQFRIIIHEIEKKTQNNEFLTLKEKQHT